MNPQKIFYKETFQKKKEYKGKHVINPFLMDKYMDD
jgi:hypothetical protein